MRNICKRYKSGFTLVELLVVISIIALLLSVLLPALNRAREQGKKVQCAAHLKGMAIAMHMYAMTYNNTFPAMIMPGNLSTMVVNGKGKSFWHQLALTFAENRKLLRCPSLNQKRIVQWNDPTFLTGFGLNYNGWNWDGNKVWKENDPEAGFGYVMPEDPRGGCVNSLQVGRQSEFIMLGDTNGNKQTNGAALRSYYTYGIVGPPRTLGKIPAASDRDLPDVHNGGGNIAFLDSHIQWYKTAELMSDKNLYLWKRGKK